MPSRYLCVLILCCRNHSEKAVAEQMRKQGWINQKGNHSKTQAHLLNHHTSKLRFLAKLVLNSKCDFLEDSWKRTQGIIYT